MKIVFYSPYVPQHFGGGEKYFFDVALTYAQKHQVYIALPYNQKKADLAKIKTAYQDFLHRDLSAIKFVISPFGGNNHRLQKLFWTGKFDYLYYVTDGSAFFSLAKKRNLMHIQVPLAIKKKTGLEKLKFNSFQVINTNSQFTKKVIEKYWGLKVDLVCQPGIDTAQFHQDFLHKERIILNVGRFFDQLHCKNQLVLVEFFRHLITKYPQEMKGWQLVFIGKVESESYVNQVKKLAAGLPIKIITDADYQTLVQYYKKAAIYWHATGFYDDPTLHPEKMEHFGISTVEAMAAGCVPIVIAKGGQLEILGNELQTLAWLNQTDCLRKTLRFVRNPKLIGTYGPLAQKRAEKFNLKNFEKKCWQQLEMKIK